MNMSAFISIDQRLRASNVIGSGIPNPDLTLTKRGKVKNAIVQDSDWKGATSYKLALCKLDVFFPLPPVSKYM
jgi:hypothetical protein